MTIEPKSSYLISNRTSGKPKVNGTIHFVMKEGDRTISYRLKWNWRDLVINSIFSFYHSTRVSLGDSIIIFGGYDHHKRQQNLKNIGKVILSQWLKLIWHLTIIGGSHIRLLDFTFFLVRRGAVHYFTISLLLLNLSKLLPGHMYSIRNF